MNFGRRWNKADLKRLKSKVWKGVPAQPHPQLPGPGEQLPRWRRAQPVKPKSRAQRPSGFDSKLEEDYDVILHGGLLSGELKAYTYGSVKLRLAKKTWLTPDFFLQYADGRLAFHETKGYMRDDAAVKLKVAADRFPWAEFWLVTREAGIWQWKQIIP